jgi:multiple antibiotic resistance protein
MFEFFIALIVIMNPIGNLAIYVGLIDVNDKKLCFKTANISSIAILIILLLSLWVGWPILDFFGITIGAFQVAGGLIILGIAMSMLKGKTHQHKYGGDSQSQPDKDSESIAVVPMAIPIIAGPGAMTVLITRSHSFNFFELFIASIICIIIAIIFWFSLRYAPKISTYLGEEGMRIVSRVMGLILAAISVQMLAQGLISLFPSLV